MVKGRQRSHWKKMFHSCWNVYPINQRKKSFRNVFKSNIHHSILQFVFKECNSLKLFQKSQRLNWRDHITKLYVCLHPVRNKYESIMPYDASQPERYLIVFRLIKNHFLTGIYYSFIEKDNTSFVCDWRNVFNLGILRNVVFKIERTAT